MTAVKKNEHLYVIRTNTPGKNLSLVNETSGEETSTLKVVNSFGPKTARVTYLDGICIGPDSYGGEIEEALSDGEQPVVVVDNVIKASRIFQVLQHLNHLKGKKVIAVSGLSGAGKSQFSSLLASYLIQSGINTRIVSIDNYYHRVSTENSNHRSSLLASSQDELYDYVGSNDEVDLKRLSKIAKNFKKGSESVELRRMDLAHSKLVTNSEKLNTDNLNVLLIEGTWGLAVENVDIHILLKSRPDLTLTRRIKRAREPITPELEQTIFCEQRKLDLMADKADIQIYDDYFIEFSSGRLIEANGSSSSQSKLEELLSVQHEDFSPPMPSFDEKPSSTAAPYCSFPAVPTREAKIRARDCVHSMVTPSGILASSTPIMNYRRIWARDSVVIGLGGLLAKDEKIATGLKNSLNLLADNVGPDGQIPSNINVDESGEIEHVSYGGLAGRVDTIPWYIIGVCNYAGLTDDPAFLERHIPVINKSLDLLGVWEFNRRGLVYVPQGGDWADEYILQGYVFLPQALRLWALQAYGSLTNNQKISEQAAKLRNLLEVNYWPDEKNIKNPAIYHPTAFSTYLEDRPECNKFEACLSPMGYSRQFDYFGNAVATLLKLGTDEQRKTLINVGQDIIDNLLLNLSPAFWPPIMETDPEWPILRLSFRDTFRNEPFSYHNGGMWPMVSGWWGAALASEGFTDESIEILNNIHTANSSGQEDSEWEFNECLSSRTGKPNGITPSAWSGAAPLFLHSILFDDANLVI